jgi:hypothetical protein
MEYISAEEFLKQPKEIQKVFLDWWKPSVGDLISFKVCIDLNNPEDKEVVYALKEKTEKPNKLKDIPLFTEGQLRKFIEDKTERRINEITYYEGTGYDIALEYFDGLYGDLGTDLLQAYWKVALVVAKE